MKVNFKTLTNAEKGKICLLHQDVCMASCPLRVVLKRSIICLRDIEKLANFDMRLDIDDKTMLICRNVISTEEKK